MKALPKVGQTVLVTLKSNQKDRAKLTTGKRVVSKIKAIYEGGHVLLDSGDIWNVAPLETGQADFITKESAEA